MKISITKGTETLCACNSCNAKNYESFCSDTPKEVDTLYEIRIGCMVNRLCSDCLAALIGKATAALASAE